MTKDHAPPQERPILFSTPMVQAILDGRKDQTRRILKPQPNSGPNGKMVDLGGAWGLSDGCLSGEWRCPYGQPGDRLWVRETWGTIKAYDHKCPRDLIPSESTIGFKTDPIGRWCQTGCNGAAGKWRPSIFMPRWASRITLEITEIRVELLQAISNDDARAEGIPLDSPAVVWAYRQIWEAINGKRSWAENPWVWAISFRRVNP